MVNGIEELNKASKNGYAVPQFNINNLEWTKYILEECEDLRSPVILGVSEKTIKYMGGFNTVYNVVHGLISDLNITIPVILHLDHGKSLEICKNAIDAGFTSVQIDLSEESIDKNIEITKEVVMYAKKKNVSVEAEVGYIGIRGNIISEDMYAKVIDCINIYEKTGINSLAPAIGNVHGMYIGNARINYNKIKEINNAIPIPLVLHGGTGVSDEDVKQCIKYGIAKVNINTELQVEWSKSVREYLNKNKEVYDPRKIISSGETVLRQVVRNKIVLLNSNNRI